MNIPRENHSCKFPNPDGSAFNTCYTKTNVYLHAGWETLIDWEREEDDDLVRSVSIETTKQWDKLAKERGIYLPFTYMDHSSRDQNPLASYGPENIARLKRISRKYDPSQAFQKLQKDGFLLSKS
jgi:hypothetical protein